MKLFLCFFLFVSFFICGCSSVHSPIGEWELYVKKNDKFEKLLYPATIMTIYSDGKFTCIALESQKPEQNDGTWKQKGERIIFYDHDGEHAAIMDGNDRIIHENQPFKKFGTKLLFIRKQIQK